MKNPVLYGGVKMMSAVGGLTPRLVFTLVVAKRVFSTKYKVHSQKKIIDL